MQEGTGAGAERKRKERQRENDEGNEVIQAGGWGGISRKGIQTRLVTGAGGLYGPRGRMKAWASSNSCAEANSSDLEGHRKRGERRL